MLRIELDPIPNIRFEGGPAHCTIIATSFIQGELRLFVRISVTDKRGTSYVVYNCVADSAYRDIPPPPPPENATDNDGTW